MSIRITRTRLLVSCVAISIILHLCVWYATRFFATYDFGAAVSDPAAVTLDLNAAPPEVSVAKAAAEPDKPAEESAKNEPAAGEEAPVPEESVESPEPQGAPVSVVSASAIAAATPEEVAPPAEPVAASLTAAAAAPVARAGGGAASEAEEGTETQVPVSAETAQQLHGEDARPGGNTIFSAKHEKLIYSVTMMGMPVGSAELEAKNENRVTTITLKVQSNAAVASIYPVFNYVETQHIDGKYLLTKVRQQEGAFRSDEAFSINLQKKRVSLSDNIRYRNLKLTVPTDDVLDTLSGIYSLRKRDLQVGRTETLHIFDSETYAEVPVEILRREEIRLPNAKKVAALVVRPLQKTGGIFRRTGDILIWVTDDAAKVPVRLVTTIALGKVTADLVSAEREEQDAGEGKENVAAGW